MLFSLRLLGVTICAVSFAHLGYTQTYTPDVFLGGGVPDSIAATSASIGSPAFVALDAQGNLYITSTAYHVVFKLDVTGMLTRFAGNGLPGFGGDGGPAVGCQFSNPTGLAVGSGGELYVADTGNNRIRRISNGVVTTFVGDGSRGFGGDGGPAVSARLNSPFGLAVASSGDLFVADRGNNRIRRVAGGAISSVAGMGEPGFDGDGALAIDAKLSGPVALTLDSLGNLYIADNGNGRVRQVRNDVITTIAGNGKWESTGDFGPAANAALRGPNGVALDSAGTLYVSEYYGVRRISMGRIETAAGGFYNASGLVVNSDNSLFIADSGNLVVRRLKSGELATIAGGGAPLDGGGAANRAQLLEPVGLSVSADGSLFIADVAHARIRRVANGAVETVVGNGQRGYSGDGGPAIEARLFWARGVAAGPGGKLYIADTYNNRVRAVSNGVIQTIAGGGLGSVTLSGPHDVAVHSDGSVYISDTRNHCIRKVLNGEITTVAGTGTAGFSGDGGPATLAQFNEPRGIAVGPDGAVYIADFRNHRIRRLLNGTLTTVAGDGSYGFRGDNGPATMAWLTEPQDVAADNKGNIYIADLENHRIRRISNGIITTIAGGGTSFFGGGPATNVKLGTVAGLTANGDGQVYVADSDTHRVIILNPTALPCAALVSSTQLSAHALGANLSVSVEAPPSCPWAVEELPEWVEYAGPSVGVGPANLVLRIDPNLGAPRSALVSIAGQPVAIEQNGFARGRFQHPRPRPRGRH